MKKILVIQVLLFSTILLAQENKLEEYERVLDKYRTDGKTNLSEVSIEDKEMLFQLYSEMSEVEKNTVSHPIVKLSPRKLEEKQPTAELINDWKNDQKFGVWIDGNRIDNNILNNYNFSDFSTYTVSKLHKNAVNYGKHYFQVNLMTNSHYKEYLKKKPDEHYAFINRTK